MLPTARSVAAAVVAEVPDLPPLAAELRTAARKVGRAAEMVPNLDPVLDDVQDAVSAWKTAGQAVTVACFVVSMAAVVGLLVLSTWKPEEFR